MIHFFRRRSNPGPDGVPGSSRSRGRRGGEEAGRTATPLAASPGAWLGEADDAAATTDAAAPARLEVVSRAGCHLCEQTATRLAPVAERHGAHLVLLDIDADESLAAYSEHVPVVLLDGVEVDRLLVDVARVEQALAAR